MKEEEEEKEEKKEEEKEEEPVEQGRGRRSSAAGRQHLLSPQAADSATMNMVVGINGGPRTGAPQPAWKKTLEAAFSTRGSLRESFPYRLATKFPQTTKSTRTRAGAH